MMFLVRSNGFMASSHRDLIFCHLAAQLRAETEGVGWHRAGSDICYFKNQLSRATAKNKPFWTLTFSFQTDYDDDTVYLAHSFPYRYDGVLEFRV